MLSLHSPYFMPFRDNYPYDQQRPSYDRQREYHHETPRENRYYDKQRQPYFRQPERLPESTPHYHSCNEEHYTDRRPDYGYDRPRRFDDRHADSRHLDNRYPDTRYDRHEHRDYERPEPRYIRDHRPLVRHDWDRRPDRVPHRDRPQRLDRNNIDPLPRTPAFPQTEAFEQLTDQLFGSRGVIDRGVSANDLRSGKHGVLSPEVTAELAKLDKNTDYRLVNEYGAFSSSYLWVPINDGPSEVISFMDPTIPASERNSPLLTLLERESIIPKENNVHLTASDLRAGRFGRVSDEVQKSLAELDPKKDYNLISDYSPTNPTARWVEMTSD